MHGLRVSRCGDTVVENVTTRHVRLGMADIAVYSGATARRKRPAQLNGWVIVPGRRFHPIFV